MLFDIEISPVNSDIIYLGYYDLGFMRSLDRGKSWQNSNHSIYTGAWKGDGGNTFTIAADPTRANVVWAGQSEGRSTAAYLLRSSQSGANNTWVLSSRGLPFPNTALFGLSVDPNSPENNRTLFVTANKNVYRSLDDGYNWSLVLETQGKSHFTAIDYFDGNLVYAGGSGGLWRSESGGASGTWQQVGILEMQGAITGDIWQSNWTGVMDIKTDRNKIGRAHV